MSTISSNYSLQELTESEKVSVNGGWSWLVPIIIGAAVVEIMSDWDNFKAGLSGHPPKN